MSCVRRSLSLWWWKNTWARMAHLICPPLQTKLSPHTAQQTKVVLFLYLTKESPMLDLNHKEYDIVFITILISSASPPQAPTIDGVRIDSSYLYRCKGIRMLAITYLSNRVYVFVSNLFLILWYSHSVDKFVLICSILCIFKSNSFIKTICASVE